MIMTTIIMMIVILVVIMSIKFVIMSIKYNMMLMSMSTSCMIHELYDSRRSCMIVNMIVSMIVILTMVPRVLGLGTDTKRLREGPLPVDAGCAAQLATTASPPPPYAASSCPSLTRLAWPSCFRAWCTGVTRCERERDRPAVPAELLPPNVGGRMVPYFSRYV